MKNFVCSINKAINENNTLKIDMLIQRWYSIETPIMLCLSADDREINPNPLYYSIASHNITAVNAALQYAPNAKIINASNQNLLHYAIFKSSPIKIIEILIQYGININEQDCMGNTPAHYAAMYKNYTALNLLLDNKAEIKKNLSARTPLDYCRNDKLWLSSISQKMKKCYNSASDNQQKYLC